jgi:hypothetical protein
MSWTDEEIEKIVKEAAGKSTFEYKTEYWADIEKMLPVKKSRRLGVWWWTANVFLVGFMVWTIGEISFDNPSKENTQVLKLTTPSKKIEKHRKLAPESSPKGVKEALNSSKTSNTPSKRTNSNRILTSKKTKKVHLEKDNDFLDGQLKSLTGNVGLKSLDLPNDLSQYSVKIGNLPLMDLAPLGEESRTIQKMPPYTVKRKSSYYLELNGGVGQQWMKNTSNPSRVNSSYGFAIGYMHQFKGFGVSTGVGLSATNFADLAIKERTKIYGFGSSIIDNSYEFSSIYALTIPVNFTKTFGRQTVGIGLTGTVNMVSLVKHLEVTDGQETENEVGLTGTKLFNKIGLQPEINYSIMLTEKMQLGLRMQVQLMQPTNSDRFIGSPVKMPVSGQLFVKRTIQF